MLREVFAPSTLVRLGPPGLPNATDVDVAFSVTLGFA